MIAIALLLASLIALLVFFWITRDAMSDLPLAKGRTRPAASTVVDLLPWENAEALAHLAATAEEMHYAREAEHLADHEIDQAFAAALRQAANVRPILNANARQLQQRIQQLGQLVKDDQARVQTLTREDARGTTAASIPGLLDVAKAQLGLDSDELTDAQQDFARAVGDRRNAIQQELAAHEAEMRKHDTESARQSPLAIDSAQQYGSLAKLLAAWFAAIGRQRLIEQAFGQSQSEAAALLAEHNRLEAAANAPSVAVPAGAPAQAGLTSTSAPEPDTALEVASINSRAALRQLLSIDDDRIQTTQQLAAVYRKWSTQVSGQRRILVHLLLQSIAIIAVILLSLVLFDALARLLIERSAHDRRRLQTFRTMARLALQIFGLVLILLVVFGVPNQMPTIIGFTTAGLTVVLQDFILSFLGWFILMGKNGIRVGDWVEINGISGEVIETGLFRTVMLETGNWTDKGHPTGRRVTLMNSFAVKGQYFNFSTTGQWMWDEITLTIAPAENTYHVIELIHKAVLDYTEHDAQMAEQEWKRVTKRKGLGQFTAASSIDMRPGIYGLDIIVRYVTRASERFEVRNRLYQRVIELLNQFVAPHSRIDQPRPVISSTE